MFYDVCEWVELIPLMFKLCTCTKNFMKCLFIFEQLQLVSVETCM